MISLLKYLDGPWEQVRGYLKEDLEHIQEVINSNWNTTFGNGTTLQGEAIEGDNSVATRYVANTGDNNAPKWDLVNLVNGVSGRLAFNHLPVVDNSKLLGRRSSTSGDPEEITLGTNLTMAGTTLSATGGGDASTNTATSVDGELTLFSGTGGKTLKRATGSGIVKAASGVYSVISIPSDTVQFLNGGASPAFSKPTTKITGTATNDNAIAGDIGELATASLASGSATSLTTATAKTVTSVSLTAGDWDIDGIIDYSLSGTTATAFKSGSSSTTNTFGAADTFANIPLGTTTLTDTFGHVIPTQRFSLASTTTVYLVAQATFSAGTVAAYGTIRARRVR